MQSEYLKHKIEALKIKGRCAFDYSNLKFNKDELESLIRYNAYIAGWNECELLYDKFINDKLMTNVENE